MPDIAQLGLAVDSSQVERGTVTLHQLTGAAGAASAAARQLAGASQAEAAGQKAATAATMANTAALHANAAAAKMAAMNRRNLLFQLNDVGVSLASGMNPLMVLVQQGSQIATIYEGGVVPALRETAKMVGSMATRFGPFLGVLGAAALLLQGMTNEINAVDGANISMLDTALAVFQSINDGIKGVLGPAFKWLSDEVERAVNDIFAATDREVNAIIGAFIGAVEAIKAVWGQIPEALGYITYEAAQSALNQVIYLIRGVQVEINQFLRMVDRGLLAMGGKPLGWGMDLAEYNTAPNPYQSAGSAVDAAGAAFNNAMGQDYTGEWLNDIRRRAQDIAAARKETEGLGGAAAAANDNVKKLAKEGLSDLVKFGQSVLSTLTTGFADMFKGLLRGTTTLSEAISGLLGKLGDLFIDQGFNLLTGALGGLFGNSAGPGWGIAGGFAGFPGIFGIPGMAEGGTVGRAGLSWVGEKGPELLRLPVGAQVIPNGPSVAAANQNGGQITVEATVRVENGNIVPVITQVSGQVAGQAIRANNKQLPNMMADIQMRAG